ncbi:uncharacterized protein LOC109713118 [Ananas comosus]|uniref:Uncharacterized protein LOC109713118 n=1 Tax=Ananas comosus TaxID=4615 RepID=A0A6P5FAP1_ANACO|nr:uncharacterized protein LOC109713118 [Ananas comosus]
MHIYPSRHPPMQKRNTAMAPPSLTKFLLLVLLGAASSSSAHVACAGGGHQDQLTFTTRSGSYPVDAVDYANQILYVSDPSMSTCSATNPSRGFSLDWDAPFAFADARNVFALLDCFPTPTLNATLCDTSSSSSICGLLYTCPAVAALGAPVSTCCVYAPASLGPAFDVDLTQLRCASYAAVRGFNGAETRPDEWDFGIALKYRFSADDGFPSACADCEKSGGMCGYATAATATATATAAVYNSFACSCGNGMNSSTNCYFAASAASWSSGGARRRILPLGLWLTCMWLAIAWTQIAILIS